MAAADMRIENPSEPRHFARLKPVGRLVEIRRAGRALARSSDALRLLEHGRDLYDPVIYLPRSDLLATLSQRSETTHCPLKGDARYFDLTGPDGEIEVEKIAWAYPEPLPFAAVLADLIAFDAVKVTAIEGSA